MDKYRTREDVKAHRREYQKQNAAHLTQKQKELNQSRPFRYAFMRIKNRAKRVGLEFNLTEDYMKAIWTGTCAIFGTPIEIPYSTESTDPNKATLDKVDPTLGYIVRNVQWVSNRANIIKSFGTEQEHRQIADYIARHKP